MSILLQLTYDFSTSYTKVLNDKLKSKLSFFLDFAFKGGYKYFIRLSHNSAAYRKKKTKGENHLIENCCLDVGNVTMEQVIGIPMGIDPALFWVNLFLYSCEEEYMSSLLIYTFKIKSKYFHSTKHFIHDFGAIKCWWRIWKFYLWNTSKEA